MKKKKNQKELDKISCGSAETFPTQLNREEYFKCPIWFADSPKFVDDLMLFLLLYLFVKLRYVKHYWEK